MELVRGTQEEKPKLFELGKDTVYIRKNIEQIEETNKINGEKTLFWQYEEETYTYPEYFEKLDEEIVNIQLAICEVYEEGYNG